MGKEEILMTNTYATAGTQYVEAGGTRYAYRRMGGGGGVPLIFLQNIRQGMDIKDPLLLDGFGEDRPVIIFDNASVAGSSGETPDTIEAMADHVAAFLGALQLAHVDVLGFSIGGYMAIAFALRQQWVPRSERGINDNTERGINDNNKGNAAGFAGHGNQCPGRERLFHRGDHSSAIPGRCRIRSNGGVVDIGDVRGGAHNSFGFVRMGGDLQAGGAFVADPGCARRRHAIAGCRNRSV
jgi:hypothetical protein